MPLRRALGHPTKKAEKLFANRVSGFGFRVRGLRFRMWGCLDLEGFKD